MLQLEFDCSFDHNDGMLMMIVIMMMMMMMIMMMIIMMKDVNIICLEFHLEID